MIARLLVIGFLLSTATFVYASERFLLQFEITQGKNKVETGATYISNKARDWNKGLRRSYLKLRCDKQPSGKTVKQLSTIDYFSGLRITHQLRGEMIELTVLQSIVQPRLAEIRALPKDQCKDLAPIVTTKSKSYSFPAKDGLDETHSFSADMTIRVMLQSVMRKT